MRPPPKLYKRKHAGYGQIRFMVADGEWIDFQTWADGHGMGAGECVEAAIRWWISLPFESQVHQIVSSKKLDVAARVTDQATPTIREAVWEKVAVRIYHYATTGSILRAMIRGFQKVDDATVERFQMAVNMGEPLPPSPLATEIPDLLTLPPAKQVQKK
jgi:hypothetical protein